MFKQVIFIINYLFLLMFVLGLAYAMFTGRIEEVSSVLLSAPKDAIGIIIDMGAVLVFWSGILEICRKSGLLDFLTRGIIFAIHPLFKRVDKKSDAMKYIAMNLAANTLGVGSAATPFGLKAIKELDNLNGNSDTASPEMIMFLTINTSGFCLIPTSVIAMREAFGSENSTQVIPYIVCISALTTILVVIVNKIVGRKYYD